MVPVCFVWGTPLEITPPRRRPGRVVSILGRHLSTWARLMRERRLGPCRFELGERLLCDPGPSLGFVTVGSTSGDALAPIPHERCPESCPGESAEWVGGWRRGRCGRRSTEARRTSTHR